MGEKVPIEEGLFTWPSDDPKLIGSLCLDCGAIVFPAQSGCPRCTSDNTERKEFKEESFSDNDQLEKDQETEISAKREKKR